MKRLTLPAIIAVLALAGCTPSGDEGTTMSAAERTTATVVRVTDGDTVVLSGLGRSRLIGIDTPEVYGRPGCFGREASDFTKQLLQPGDRVRYSLGREPRDRYRRHLIYLWLDGDHFVNEMLITGGYAVPLTIPPNDAYAAHFNSLAGRARRQHVGLWSRSTCNGNRGAARRRARTGSGAAQRASRAWCRNGGRADATRPKVRR